MKKEYENINEFIDDVHEEINLKELLFDIGVVKDESEFHGQFIRCIFHDNDDTPSLQIGEKFFRCYACDQKGDVIKFFQLFYNIEFIEAVMKLAEVLNVNIKTIKFKYNKKYDKLQNEWEDYLKQMEEADSSIQKLQRDYFPQEIGYDKKLNYIVLPITSKTGAILGFTKRRVDDSETEIRYIDASGNEKVIKRPKWKHSSLKDSLIGQCHNMFNLNIATPEIIKKKQVISTEGPKDVIAYRRINKNNTICVCGTGNSNNIWDLILPVDEIVLSYDLDEAGIKATIQNSIYLSSFFDISKIKSVILPKDMDPYDVVTNNKYGNKYLENAFNERIEVIEFVIKYGTVEDVYKIYDSVPEFNRMYILKNICKLKAFSIDEAMSWILSVSNNNNIKEKNNEELKIEEKEKLISIINGNCNDYDYKEYSDDPIKAIDKIKKILKLKYNIVV